jgi:hypothetical protein
MKAERGGNAHVQNRRVRLADSWRSPILLSACRWAVGKVNGRSIVRNRKHGHGNGSNRDGLGNSP